MRNSNPAIWFEIYVQDMGRAKAFYESVFQCKLERLNSPDLEMWSFPMDKDKAGAGGALIKVEGVASGFTGTLVYFGCEDCAVEAARAREFGGRIHRDKISIGEYGFIALVIDTEGNMIGLQSMQ
jgi:uncharacterized protein